MSRFKEINSAYGKRLDLKVKLDILTPPDPWQEFARQYISLRHQELRVPNDTTLKHLPKVASNHPHAKAWKMRMHGLENLVTVLNKTFSKPAHILDIGCGNGWMSNRIAKAGFAVTGIDINLPELEQAHRVFARTGLRFAFADLFSWQPDTVFNGALIASALQYFENPQELLAHLFNVNPQLTHVFISDTPFYHQNVKNAAAQRSHDYYLTHGFPELAKHYHHHALSDLGHPYTIVYKPKPRLIQTLWGSAPFPIIAVTRNL